jgi:hypothetical protein
MTVKRYNLDFDSLVGVVEHPEGSFVFSGDFDKIKQEISLAEEGLANYAQENERLKDALERIRKPRYGLEQNATDEERATYWSDMALAYRDIAAAALRLAQPQPREQKT